MALNLGSNGEFPIMVNMMAKCRRKSEIRDVFISFYGEERYDRLLASPQPLCLPQIEDGMLYLNFYFSDHLYFGDPSISTEEEFPSTCRMTIRSRHKAELRDHIIRNYGEAAYTRLLATPNPYFLPQIHEGVIYLNFFL